MSRIASWQGPSAWQATPGQRPRYWLGHARLRPWRCRPICRSQSERSSTKQSSSRWHQLPTSALVRACRSTHATSPTTQTSRPCALSWRSVGHQKRRPPHLRCGAPWTCHECHWRDAPTTRVVGRSPNRALTASRSSRWLWWWPRRTRMSTSTRTTLGWAARSCWLARSARRRTQDARCSSDVKLEHRPECDPLVHLLRACLAHIGDRVRLLAKVCG